MILRVGGRPLTKQMCSTLGHDPARDEMLVPPIVRGTDAWRSKIPMYWCFTDEAVASSPRVGTMLVSVKNYYIWKCSKTMGGSNQITIWSSDWAHGTVAQDFADILKAKISVYRDNG
jgi:hypothetical protein